MEQVLPGFDLDDPDSDPIGQFLLTRARQGMAIFVPPGDHRDPTRLPKFYDGTFEYLRELGLSLA